MTTEKNYTLPKPSERLIHYEDVNDIPQAWQKEYDETKEIHGKFNRTVSAYIIFDTERKTGKAVYGVAKNGRTFAKHTQDLLPTDQVIGAVIQSLIGVHFN